MQITITENNIWEGESFSYIIEVDEKEVEKIESFLRRIRGKIPATYKVERNTTFTKEKVEILNKQSKNCYMDRYGFYELPENPDYNDASLLYKSGDLNKLT